MPEKSSFEESQFQYRLRKTPIAVVGMSALFPKAQNLQQYWENILNEVDCITEVPASRWKLEDHYDPDPNAPDRTYSKKGGFIPDVDFDPMEFGLPPNILEITDVSQLLSLVMAREALKNGNYENASEEIRKRTGVILGVGGGQKLTAPLVSRLQHPIWRRVLTNVGVSEEDTEKIIEKILKAYVRWEENSFPGTLGNVISGRITNRLDLGGTNCVVDAACASSLSGIRMAVAELLDYRTDMMITGGIDTDNSAYMYMCFSKTPAFTEKDVLQPFDVESEGIMIGEGIGMLLLKRLEDAERDGDRIYSVIRGIGSSSDGRFKSIYAPRQEGQMLALSRAYEEAGFDHKTIGLIEAHGTGTRAGDLTEVTALVREFGVHDDQKQHIALGSVKSQIGHTKNAAGAASMIKISLALYHKILPPTINVKTPNPEFGLEQSPFYLNTTTRPWIRPAGGHPRRAGVSAFGFGGTNFHFVLEEYEKQPVAFRLQAVPRAIYLKGKTPQELVQSAQTVVESLRDIKSAVHFQELAEASRNISIPLEDARLGFLATDAAEALDCLETAIDKLQGDLEQEAFNTPKGIYYRKKGVDPTGKVVALFSGQGSPYLNMGKDLVYNFPPIMDAFASMDALFLEDQRPPLSSIVYPPPVFDRKVAKQQDSTLQLTQNAQPSIGVFSAGQYRLFKAAGFKPDFVAGHSFGELTALWASGVLNDEDYFMLAKARGKAMAAPDDPNFEAGGMAAIVGDLENLEEEIKEFPGIVMANFNSNKQVVLAGPKEQVKEVAAAMKKKGYTAVVLGVSAAFHTTLVGHAQKPFAESIRKATFNKPNCPVYSNATAKPYSQDPAAIQKTLEEHILNPVYFKQEVENIYADGGYFFVEFGPQQILTKLLSNILAGKEHVAVAINANAKKPGDRQLRDAAVNLKVAGLDLGDIDPYIGVPKAEFKAKTPLSMTLNGANYVSEKTRQEFEDALRDGFKIQQATPPEPIIKTVVEKVVEKVYVPQPVESKPASVALEITPKRDLNQLVASVEQGLSNFNQHQSETLRVHEQFLSNQAEYARGFFQLMTQQAQIAAASGNGTSDAIAQTLNHFHNHQNETLRVHENYLKTQTEYAKGAFELIRQQHQFLTGGKVSPLPASSMIVEAQQGPPVRPAMVTQAPIERTAPAPVQSPVAPPPMPQQQTVTSPTPVVEKKSTQPIGASEGAVKAALLAVVAEKTGYPTEMLDLEMDLESDLGIDSIKRVEILHGIQERLPALGNINPDELTEQRTLQQIVQKLKPSEAVTPIPSKVAVAAVSASTNGREVQEALLAVVSEKTGYPTDMLNLEMDMESDLGIDSIKRVEILHGIQERLPNLPTINPDDLSELRTLRQIADQVSSSNQPTQKSQKSIEVATVSPSAIEGSSSKVTGSEVSAALLQVVSQKTGYPTDMLSLDMDMESDLGIDSIKRVEILHGIQELLPGKVAVDPDVLSDLRTLAQIATQLSRSAETGSLNPSPANVAAEVKIPTASVESLPATETIPEGVTAEEVRTAVLKVVSEKTGYPMEMIDLGMDMESDLGIDSIKRVEILHGIEEILSNTQQVSPDSVADLRTLAQIVEKLASATPVVGPNGTLSSSPGKGLNGDGGRSMVESAVLAVVSEKTGYPAEMLNTEMDMESDLGIDSIKRVEILHGVQEKVPSLSPVNPDELTELRTLEQIIQVMASKLTTEGDVPAVLKKKTSLSMASNAV